MLGDFQRLNCSPHLIQTGHTEGGHDLGGYLSGNKVSDMITNYFHWPGVVKDCINYCKSCTKCQRTSKYMPPKAPIVERPVLSEPFESMAVDLVGPLPKGKGGARFILTTICLAMA